MPSRPARGIFGVQGWGSGSGFGFGFGFGAGSAVISRDLTFGP